jgi:tetratricopeptide (TPR) repeat protein
LAQDTKSSDTADDNSRIAIKLYNESLQQCDDGHYSEALSMVNKAVSFNPDLLQAVYNRGCIFLKLNRPDRAIHDFSTVISKDKDTKAFVGRGTAYFMKEDYLKANEEFSSAIATDQTYAEAYYMS